MKTKTEETPSIKIYSEDDFKGLKKAGSLAARTLEYIEKLIKPGVKTNFIDEVANKFLNDHGAFSAPLFYRGYTKSICTSINHVVCHGIPSDQTLKEGDIINIDITSILNGYYGDTSKTFSVGNVSIEAKKLIQVTYESMMEGIKILKPGITLGDIGFAIQSFAESNNCSVVRDFCGHGVGKTFHEEPNILHYGKKGEGITVKKGMVFTIEPMINLGEYHTKVLSDGWTAVTKDKSLSAQFEHTVGIIDNGYEIFTL
ncbi:MAG: type I methionyl aminopeptidase [Candidatus Fonsibacter ubiquis]|nr:type I methionyl aminopeptidase [Candidatus Fonsibacter ubiquis]